ncbi:MAG: response regulator transcription factor [Bacteroidetes bacterium]|nr:response regulator transcription factor [Bacteroidota bacterium]
MSKPAILTLVIADDHPIVRKGLRDIVDTDPSFEIRAETDNGLDAWEAISRYRPDLAVLDVSMPGMSGLEVAKAVRDAGLDTAVVILTVYDDEEICNKAIETGVRGYILKDCTTQDILLCLHRVAEGDYFISPSLTSGLLRDRKDQDAITEQSLGIERLTRVEHNVLHLIARNKSTKEIASELFISPRTVDRHRYNIAGKLDLHGNLSLLRFALEHRDRL